LALTPESSVSGIMPMTALPFLYVWTVVKHNGNILQPWLHPQLAAIQAEEQLQSTTDITSWPLGPG
jgi:hypothetical protein